MIGGFQNFGNSDWQNTPLADLMPVNLEATGQVEGPVQMEPTQQGFNHYLLRLADKPERGQVTGTESIVAGIRTAASAQRLSSW